MAKKATPKIKAESRDRTGTRYALRARQSGKLPAVIYGHKKDPVSIAVNALEFRTIMQKHSHLLEVEQDGHTQSCLIKDIQWDHLGSTILHVDLARVDLTETVTIDMQLTFVGEAIGLKEENTIIEHPTTVVKVQCQVSDIPHEIRVDVSEMKVGDRLTVANLVMPEGVKCVESPESVVAAVRIVEEIEEPVAEVTAESAEPEVIGRPKEDEEGAEAEGADKGDKKAEKKPEKKAEK